MGWFGWRSAEDEELVENIVMACADNSKMTIQGGATESGGTKPERIKIKADTDDECSSSDTHNGSLMSMEVVPDPPNVKVRMKENLTLSN